MVKGKISSLINTYSFMKVFWNVLLILLWQPSSTDSGLREWVIYRDFTTLYKGWPQQRHPSRAWSLYQLWTVTHGACCSVSIVAFEVFQSSIESHPIPTEKMRHSFKLWLLLKLLKIQSSPIDEEEPDGRSVRTWTDGLKLMKPTHSTFTVVQ